MAGVGNMSVSGLYEKFPLFNSGLAPGWPAWPGWPGWPAAQYGGMGAGGPTVATGNQNGPSMQQANLLSTASNSSSSTSIHPSRSADKKGMQFFGII